MMETYADLLKREKEKVEKNMTNYDMDQLRREGKVPDLQKRKEFAEDIIESEKETTVTFYHEIAVSDFLHLAKAAHERKITLNQLFVDVITSSFNDLDYRFEHSSKPVVLKEY